MDEGGQASWHSCDDRQMSDVQAMIAQVVHQYVRIHGLVNNAGGQYTSPFSKTSAKGWQAVIDTNLTGGFLVARKCFNQSMQVDGDAVVHSRQRGPASGARPGAGAMEGRRMSTNGFTPVFTNEDQ